jgi:hypothetical protein
LKPTTSPFINLTISTLTVASVSSTPGPGVPTKPVVLYTYIVSQYVIRRGRYVWKNCRRICDSSRGMGNYVVKKSIVIIL